MAEGLVSSHNGAVSRRNSTVYRVTGLSAEHSDDALETELSSTIKGELTGEESELKVLIDIVPSCYDPEQEKVALVKFSGRVPTFLSELEESPLGDWQVEMGETDISFDRHFFGFTQLYTPKPGEPISADIIAITGLDGHAYGSWMGKGNLGRMWLRHFLSKDLPSCRTMIYGYNSKLSTHGIDTIMDYGLGMIEELKKVRNAEELCQRPLFFIAHSFGGIILAHCLVKAVQTNEDDHPTVASLHNATYGMLLFGIPHKGLVVDDIQQMLLGQDDHPRSILLDQISSKSDLLAHQLSDFKNLIRDRKVVSFYETEQTRRLEFDTQRKRWRRTGNFITMVDTESALLQLPDHMEDKIPLNTDHSMMVKFKSKNDQGYKSVLERLRQFQRDAPGVVRARFVRKRGPKPCSMVPFARDGSFVGREDTIADMGKRNKQAAVKNHSRVALIGLGGVGKSQIAIEYAYRVRESAPQTWVFWVHASTSTRFEQAYREIATKCEIPGHDDPKADILRLVFNWLCDESNGQWLMILDSADDDRVFRSSAMISDTTQASNTAPKALPLKSFLPQTPNGQIVVTSRDRRAATNLVGQKKNIIEVEPMADKDALALLTTRVPLDGSSEDKARALVRALEGIPLAITHAAAYIELHPRMTVSTYFDLFRENEQNQAHLLSSDKVDDLRRDPSIPHAVITTWQISFNQIRETVPAAADLLSLMAMFDNQGIPELLLYEGRSQVQFTDVVEPLTSFSLIQPQAQALSFEMHSLVQLSTAKWLEQNEKLDIWRKKSLEVIAMKFPNGEYESWSLCQVLFPHAIKVLGYASNDQDPPSEWRNVAHRAGCYMLHTGTYRVAEELFVQVMETGKRVLGQEHPNTLTSMANLASTYRNQGRWKEAEELFMQVIETMKRVLGQEHPNTLTSMANLSLTLKSQGKNVEAIQLMQR